MVESLPIVWETRVWFWVELYQRLKKWYLMPPCLTLSIIRYVSRGKWSNPGKRVAPSHTPQCSSYWKGCLQVAIDYGCHLYLYFWSFIHNIPFYYGRFACYTFYLSYMSWQTSIVGVFVVGKADVMVLTTISHTHAHTYLYITNSQFWVFVHNSRVSHLKVIVVIVH